MAGTDLGFYSFVIMLAMIMMMMAGYKDDFDSNDDFDVLHDEYDMQVCSYEACNIFKLYLYISLIVLIFTTSISMMLGCHYGTIQKCHYSGQ